ncbi:efflux transporter periplasmic adaptor subunit [Mesorhizobium hawassense]|uniref:Efflux transporter periplasmic adaptor subunit n=1 Tax=Mesorhizobium hawassense TaxID=1209954 RepID=A0A330HU87_9HYPH|nr:HlyD family efflux transporter periplasmic adaptor subunit [Mesorhizobium hawassense]RAZ90464.1 efflux transporter periplasmic adaptor subunit [Mesorhizobium hawassense]
MRFPAVLALFAGVALAGGGYAFWNHEKAAQLPAGLAAANGRIEVERVEIASKLAGRVAEIRVKEGDSVQAGSVVARLDTSELLAQLAAAKAAVQRAEAGISRARADIVIRQAEHHLSEVEMQRASELERRSAGTTAEAERRTAEYDVAGAQILGARAALEDATAAKVAAEAQVDQIEATIADTTLTTPTTGRVEYKLVQTGEVIAAGGRVATVLDLNDVFMTIFLPTGAAGSVAMGSQARIVLDAAPGYVVPATVSFVAAQAQFTPKSVETENEREKLMYRVKLAIDPALLETYRGYVKSGLTGNAYLKLDPAATWPAWLEPRLPDVGE